MRERRGDCKRCFCSGRKFVTSAPTVARLRLDPAFPTVEEPADLLVRPVADEIEAPASRDDPPRALAVQAVEAEEFRAGGHDVQPGLLEDGFGAGQVVTGADQQDPSPAVGGGKLCGRPEEVIVGPAERTLRAPRTTSAIERHDRFSA